jgi:hypothetical protein
MAESKGNAVTYGMSGTMAKLVVFRSRLGRTFVSGYPRPSTKPPSSEQVVRRSNFAEAVRYAKAAIKDPETKAMYAAMASPFQSAFNAAIKDYLSRSDAKDGNTAAQNLTGIPVPPKNLCNNAEAE